MGYEGPRGTRKEEFGSVMALVDSIFVSARKKGMRMEDAFPQLFNMGNLENMRIMLPGGKPVSHIGISEVGASLYGCALKVGMIGAVCTDPDHRNKGLAGKVLADCMRKLLVDGVDFVMVSGIRSLYDRNNCVMAGRSYAYAITSRNAGMIRRLQCDLADYDPSMLGEVAAIYQTEPVRYVRSREDFSTLLGRRTYRRPKTFLIGMGGRSVAYVCVEVNDYGKGSGWVVEYAGSRFAVASALPKLLRRLSLEKLSLQVPHHDYEMLAALSRVRKPKPSHFGGTMRIVNPEGFLEKLRPYLACRVGEKARKLEIASKDQRPVIALGNERLELKDEKELTWLLFGQPEKVDERFKSYLRPFSVESEGELGRVLSAAFPLPTFLYGLNYA